MIARKAAAASEQLVQVDELEFVNEHEKVMEQTEDLIAKALAVHSVKNISGSKRKAESTASSSVAPLKLWGDSDSSSSDDEEVLAVSEKAKGKKRAKK
jgi:hypothetical protein